ncbi:DNA-binding transcriptional regulator, LysR family [Pseudonocardia thermophila]|uniref:DNA-binding transcriptional regulator, LysR family n=1 Tax=Pseudonocardia thermophila TaxID=1848 RepID=A0A1M6ZJB3_PSETH|nr:LysR family transcriptional regulator [Pseudonocardia thermophila]SHL30433.1 DNA-binding transcriptional regulator, LysR family [Pseudonocardia thermophila]
MDVQRLRVLRELADRGSVTAVAAALSYTPSAISQQLKILGAEVGLVLTEPDGRGIRLTEAGKVLAAEAEHVLTALARAEAAMARLRAEPQGRVRIALFQSAARMMAAGLLSRLDDEPGVELELRDVDMVPAQVPALAAEFDIVVTHRDEHTEPPRYVTEGRWQVEPLLREPLDVVMPREHPLANRDGVALVELADEEWLGVQVGWPVDDVLRSLAIQTGTNPRVVQRINDFSVTEELVAAGRGIALLPRWSTDLRGGRLVNVPITGVRAARLIEAVLRPSAAQRPAVATVLAAVRAEAAEIASR